MAYLLMPRMPGKPQASDSLKTGEARSDRLPLEDVVFTHPWLSMNTPEAVNVLWVESDRADFRELLDRAMAAGLPRPAWTAEGTRGGHAAWILKTPVAPRLDDLERAGKMRRLLSVTHSYLCTAIGGDRGAALGGMTKNPWHPSWTVEVGDLVAHDLKAILLPLKAMAEAEGWQAPRRHTRASREREPSPEGRNCALFDMLRWWAGDHGERDGTAIVDKAMELNAGFSVPLSYGEAACVARSVTRGMADGRCRGRRRLSPAQAQARQAVAGKAVAQARAEDRDGRVREALATLAEQGAPATKAAVAALAGCDPRTVARSPAWGEARGGVTYAPSLSGSSSPPASPSSSSPSAPRPPRQCEEPAPAWDRSRPSRRADREAMQASLAGIDTLTHWVDAAARVAAIRACPVAEPARFLADVQEAARREELADPWSAASLTRRRRRNSRYRCEQRELWHAEAARGGLHAYRSAVAARYAVLYRERAQAIGDCADPSEDPVAYMADQERQDVARMAWAAKLKAEDRISRRWDDELQAREGEARPRFRTTLDDLDLAAQEQARARQEAA